MTIPAIGIGPLGAAEWNVGGLGSTATSGTGASSGATGGSFGDALGKAIDSLDSSQTTASTDAEQLATGQLSDPTAAVTAVENASLAMDFASSIRNAVDTDATTIFQTQM